MFTAFLLASPVLASPVLGSAALPADFVTAQEEEYFWQCNLALHEGVRLSRSTTLECSRIYNKILTHNFGGDFLSYLEWRRTNEAKRLLLSISQQE